MFASEVDLLTISTDLLDFGKKVSDQVIDLCNRVMLFNTFHNEDKHGDLIFVPGNPSCLVDRAPKAIELIKRYASNEVLLSGGVNMPNENFSEAQAMRNYFVVAGIPNDHIFLEDKSQDTCENVEFSASIIKSSFGYKPLKIMVVSSSSHIRRLLLIFSRYKYLYHPEVQIIPCPSVHPDCNPDIWYLSNTGRKTVAKELEIISRHIEKCIIPDFEV